MRIHAMGMQRPRRVRLVRGDREGRRPCPINVGRVSDPPGQAEDLAYATAHWG
jgi:hypothetical protein